MLGKTNKTREVRVDGVTMALWRRRTVDDGSRKRSVSRYFYSDEILEISIRDKSGIAIKDLNRLE